MGRPALVPFAALCWAIGWSPLAAQSAGQRRDLSAYEERIGALTDSAEVRQLERNLAQRDDTDPIVSSQRVFTLLRLHQLGNPWATRQAVGQARDVTKAHPDWPLAWHLFGRTLLVEGQRKAADPLELGRRVGFGDFEDATDAFARATSLEPTYLPALIYLQDAVAATKDTTRLTTQLLPALRRAREAGVSSPMFLFYLGRAERSFGSPTRAQDAFQSYLREGGNRGIGLHELAWAAFATGDATAETAYYEGAQEDDPASVQGYRRDLSLITTDSALAGFDSSTGAARAAWLHQFWNDRDHEALRRPGDRLAEHYRRMTYAERRYALQVNRRFDSHELRAFLFDRGIVQGSQFEIFDRMPEPAPFWTTNYFDLEHPLEMVGDTTPYDERGLVYIRQGEPDTIIETVAWGVHKNETWLYRRADGDLMLHFGNVPEDVRLVPSLGYVETEQDVGRWFVYNDRCILWGGYCKALVWGKYGKKKLRDEERRIVAASVNVATGTDAYELRFRTDLQFEATAFAVGREGAEGLVHVAWRYRPGMIPVAEPGREIALPTRVRAVLLDALGHAISWRDTTLRVRIQAGDTTVAQVGRLGLTAPPGRWTWRVALSVADTVGGIAPRGEVVVPRFMPDTVRLSDLLLAAPGEGAPWIRPEGDTAYVTPRARWFRNDPLTLYHEIYGLREGESYSSSLLLKRGKRTVLSATYTGIGSFDVTGVYRTLSLKDVSPGEYTLEIAVKGEKGPWARRSRSLTVLKAK
jgi:tetratricopeptide (TPR) repeat protein